MEADFATGSKMPDAGEVKDCRQRRGKWRPTRCE